MKQQLLSASTTSSSENFDESPKLEKAISKLRKKKIFSIEGNIGAGKTTILKLIKRSFNNLEVVQEPIEKWQNLGGENLLEKFYSDPDRWTFSFESFCMLSKLNALFSVADSDKDYIILERSLLSNKIFMDISYSLRKIDDMEYYLLQNMHEFYIKYVYPNLSGIIYLRTPVDECVKRINKRNRNEESSVDKGYLKLLEDKFDELTKNYAIPSITIDGNYDLDRDYVHVTNVVTSFMEPKSTKIVNL